MNTTLTTEQVAARYGVCTRIVNRWLDSTWLPSETDENGTRHVTMEGLQQFQERTNIQPKRPKTEMVADGRYEVFECGFSRGRYASLEAAGRSAGRRWGGYVIDRETGERVV